jgi:HrpA-like RNA helicase
VIDEAHELKKANLIMIAMLKKILSRPENKHKKLILTSATISSKVFEDYFKDFKYQVITAKVPNYHVEVIYDKYEDKLGL